MTASGLPLYRLLDPRDAADAAQRPIEDAVNIPLSELSQRTHELTSHAETILVAGPRELADQTVTWLRAHGRGAEVAGSFEYLAAGGSLPPGRLWSPREFLLDVLPRLAPGRALDLACGCGREAVYLASCGWDVTAVDVLPEALARGRALAERYGGIVRPIGWRQLDLESQDAQFESDYDLVIVFRFLHRPLLARLRHWLRPGGSLVYETFTTLHRERHGKPARDAHVLRPGELCELLYGLEIRDCSEGWRADGSHTARVWAARAS